MTMSGIATARAIQPPKVPAPSTVITISNRCCAASIWGVGSTSIYPLGHPAGGAHGFAGVVAQHLRTQNFLGCRRAAGCDDSGAGSTGGSAPQPLGTVEVDHGVEGDFHARSHRNGVGV